MTGACKAVVDIGRVADGMVGANKKEERNGKAI